MKNYICIDVGGTAIKHGVINENSEIQYSGSTKTQADKGGRHILKTVLNLTENYLSEYKCEGVCISTAGMVNVDTGEIFFSGPSIPEYKGINYKKEIEKRFNLPCEVENDVNCAGLAEYVSGAAKGSSVALILTIGTGIGGCAIIDGKVFRGFSGSACEIGYMNMNGSTFQKLGSAKTLCKKVAECKEGNTEEWCGYKIFESAENGDKDCIKAIEEMIEVLGIGIANICYVLNPETVVLGGGIMSRKDYLEKRLSKAIKSNLVDSIAEKTEIRFAENRNNAGMLGALYHFRQMQMLR